MKKLLIVLVMSALLTLAIGGIAMADEGGVHNDSATWGQAHKGAEAGFIGSHMSNDHQGKKDMQPMWGQGGIKAWFLADHP